MSGDEADPLSNHGWVPVPDPTKLTIEAQDKAVAQARLDLSAAMELVDFRLDRLRADVDAIESHHDQSLAHWMALIEEKFHGVDQHFVAVEARAKDSAIAFKTQYLSDLQSGKDALAAAFASAEKLQALTQDHNRAEVDAIKSQINERDKSVNQQLAAINKQLDQGIPVGFVAGERAQKVERRQADTLLIGVLTVIVVALSVVIAAYVATHK